jgi:membrane-associated phosphatidylinositol transfer protein
MKLYLLTRRTDMGESTSLAKWSSMELLAEEDDSPPQSGDVIRASRKTQDDSIFDHKYLSRVASERGTRRSYVDNSDHTRSHSQHHHGFNEPFSPPSSPGHQSCVTSVLVLVFHAGSVLDASSDITTKKSDITTFRGSFESVMRQHYPTLVGHVMIKLVPCPSVCSDSLGVLSSLSPYSFDASPSTADIPSLTDVPIGAIPLLATCAPDFQDAVNRTVQAGNMVWHDFQKSEEGKGFNGQVAVVSDSMGTVLVHDALCRMDRHDSEASVDVMVDLAESNMDASKLLTAPSPRRRRSSSTSAERWPKFEFETGDFFMFGSPLSIVLAARRLTDSKVHIGKPRCHQVYNLFHPTDPIAARIEPLISARFSILAPVNIPRYAKYPLGNGQPYHLCKSLC